jgi:hypothetical protein
VNGTTLHYVSGGQGPALLLIHGFPENWSAYARIMHCGPLQDEGWGVLTQLTLPGGGKLSVYEPRHARPKAMSAKAAPANNAGRSRANPAAGKADGHRRSERGGRSADMRERPPPEISGPACVVAYGSR